MVEANGEVLLPEQDVCHRVQRCSACNRRQSCLWGWRGEDAVCVQQEAELPVGGVVRGRCSVCATGGGAACGGW